MTTIINIAIIIFAVWFIAKRMMPAKGVRTITTTELKQELGKKGTQYVDVRTPGEFQVNHIKGFKNIPLQQLAAKEGELAKDKEVIVICQSGMRSTQAAKMLKKLGFTQVTNVRGGMSMWR